MYSLISGVGVFFIGTGVTSYHGIQTLFHPHAVENLSVVSKLRGVLRLEFYSPLLQAFSVLGASLLVEGREITNSVTINPLLLTRTHTLSLVTLYAALKQVRKSANESGMAFKDYGEAIIDRLS